MSDHARSGTTSDPKPAASDPSKAPATELPLVKLCPNCSAQLDDHRCKLVCPRPGCGYYMSCADYY